MGLTINFELKTKFKKKIFLWKILIVPKKRNSKVELTALPKMTIHDHLIQNYHP
jgi:hypothetical protein